MAQAVAVTTKDKDLGLKKIIAELKSLQRAEVLIGIQAGSKTKAQFSKGRNQIPGINIAQYAAQNEFGTDKIPQRSFIRSAFDENLNLIEQLVEKQYGEIIDGTKSISSGLGIIGQFIESTVKLKIRQIRMPPNSPRTIAMKGSSKPLIDFGQMFAAVRYVVKVNQKKNP